MQLLTFTLHETLFGIPIQDVEAVQTKCTVADIPGKPPYFRGITHLQGEIIAVYSLAERFGYGEPAVENLLVVNIEGRKLGIEVGRVNSIMEVAEEKVVSMPRIMCDGKNCFHDVLSDEKDLIALLDVERIMTAKEREALQKTIDEIT